MADGVLTPAVSVTSAASGLAVAKPSVSKDVTAIALVGNFQLYSYLFSFKITPRLFSSHFSSCNPLALAG